MLTAEVVFAMAILAAPSIEAPPAPWIEGLRPALLAMAIDGEILDPREKGFVLGQDLAGDLTMLRARWVAMDGNLLLAHGGRFPGRDRINELLSLNRAYRNHLAARIAMGGPWADELQKAVEDTDRLYQVWDTARDAECVYYYVTVRRQALGVLRRLIGPEAFLTGEMPPHVPTWYLSR